MQAYEFYAAPDNGFIPIPEQYRNIITTSVKVILLEEKTLQHNKDGISTRCKSDLLLSPTMNTS